MQPQQITQPTFDATAALADVQAQRAMRRRRRTWGRSVLVKHRAELVALHRAGASLGDLVVWLKSQRVSVVKSTVMRYLAKLPELQEPTDG